MMKITIILGCVVLIAGCKQDSQVSQPAESRLVANVSSNGLIETVSTTRPPVTEWCKVKIGSAGEIFVNKEPMSASDFATECARLKKAGGAIVLFVDTPNHVASPAQAEVMRKIVDAGVAMKAALKESELE
jgi:biopolymer transport protein ExbD